ncbi:hypothetical protein CYPRO_0080 [Cyclonatronum proteinivorum]|uniref:Uncharacterized protein n=1 Tax=Cyclonatronum proteinivorum TaxID=1457365 RepID=A0A345UFW7_9BACT|nr:hypothetical protein [Cyclonatronum proteinivorum]AXI99368.1 hypothetical protein CYPRO_0080 [Cyclonatronum proteinivorum]
MLFPVSDLRTGLALFFSACLIFILSAEIKAQTLTCETIDFSQNAAVPFTPVVISGIPEGLGEELILQIMLEGEEAGRVLANVQADGSYLMYTPVNPEFSLEPLAVHLRFLDDEPEGDLHSCGDFSFHIEALPAAPGFFEDYLQNFRQVMDTFGEVTQPLSPVLAEADFGDVPFAERPAIWASRLVYGYEDWPGLEVLFSGAYHEETLTPEEWEVIEAIYANRPALSGESFSRFEFRGDDIPYRENPDGSDGFETGSLFQQDSSDGLYAFAGAGTAFRVTPPRMEMAYAAPAMVEECEGPFYQPSAARLQLYFQDQKWAQNRISDIEQAGNHVADLQAGLFAIGAMAGPKGAAASRVGAVAAANMMGTGVALANLATEISQSILPTELGSFTLTHEGPYQFKEDDEEFDVRWNKAEVLAYSKAFDIAQAFTEVAWSAGGGRVLQRAYRGVSSRAPWLTSLEQEGLGIGIGDILSELNLEGMNFPACIFGPVDITEEPWTVSRTGVSGREHYLEKIDHQHFEVRETGQASPYVCVAAELMTPGASGCQRGLPLQYIPVNTEPIEVRITTASGAIARNTQEEPGTALAYHARVRHANNEQVTWSVSNPAHSIQTGGTNNHDVTIQLSSDPDDFPVTLTAESTSITGLRSRPDAQPRRHSISISALVIDERFSCLNEFEIAMTELDRCSFVAYVEGTLPASDGMPQAPISECVTGEIRSWRVNTHGIHHLEMRGQFEDGNAQLTLRARYDGEGRLVTSDFEVYGSLMKAIAQPTRTPTGEPGRMRKQPRMSEALQMRSGELTIYPLAGMPYYGSQFEMELRTLSNARRLRGTGYTIEGMLMGGESCP